MKVDMFVYNRCTTDARVIKEAAALAEAGHRIRVIAVLDPTTVLEEARDGFRIVRIDRNPIHYRALKRMRQLTGLVRRGAHSTAGAAGRAPEPVGPMRIVLAPLALARLLGRAGWRMFSPAMGALEAGTRRLLLAPHKPLMFLDYYRRAYRVARDDPPDALHAHDLNTLPVAALLAWRLGIDLTYDAHELYPEISTLSRRESRVWRFLERRLAPRATSVVTVCDSIAAELEHRYRISRPLVLLNCPPAREEAAATDNLLRQRLELPVDEPIVLYQGGFAPHRGLHTLVIAARELERGVVVLMGWGSIEEELRSLIRREHLSERVLIVGPVAGKEVVPHAAGAAVGVIPYEPVGLNNTYTTPNKLFDYMAAGVPIAASRLPELIRFVEDAGIGLTFEPGNPVALADALNTILADTEGAERMRARSREAGRRYTWERQVQRLVELYSTSRGAT